MSDSKISAKIDAFVEEVLEGSPPSPLPPAPLTRTPSDRLREKIARDSYSSASKRQSVADLAKSLPSTPSNGSQKEMPEVISNDEMTEAAPPRLVDIESQKDIAVKKSMKRSSNEIPVSANIDKKTEIIGTRNEQTPEEEPSRPGAFSVAGIGQRNGNEAVSPPSVPSVVMDVEDLPIAAELAEEGKLVEASKLDDLVVNLKSRKIRFGIFVLLALLVGAIIGGVIGAQKRKENALEECIVDDPTKLGNKQCDRGQYNTEKCNWDGGDCLVLNLYPSCALTPEQSSKLGDGICDGFPWFSKKCGKDAGDCNGCMASENVGGHDLGDGECDDKWNSAECGWDGGDCFEFHELYPGCRVPNPALIGNGDCDSNEYVMEYNSAACGWDGGDCIVPGYPECHVDHPANIGNGECDAIKGYDIFNCDKLSIMSGVICDKAKYNTEECGWDGGDCILYNALTNCNVSLPSFIGNGVCDGDEYNTEDCEWDGGDCLEFNEKYPDCHVDLMHELGNGRCDGRPGDYNTILCGWEDGDCRVENEKLWRTYPDCKGGIDPRLVGDGYCHGGAYNTAECGWDGNDCASENEKYPGCDVDDFNYIADGECDGGRYNTVECDWDGGDCLDFNERYPDCLVDTPHDIGNGECNGGEFNTLACGWDGGDCAEFQAIYPDCQVDDPAYIGDGECDSWVDPIYNTTECGWDGGDCLGAENDCGWSGNCLSIYPDCRVEHPEYLGDDDCDGGAYDTEECGWDGGDCASDWNEPEHASIKCGDWAGVDCLPNCHVEHPEYIADGFCDGGPYDTEECEWDGGDCLMDDWDW